MDRTGSLKWFRGVVKGTGVELGLASSSHLAQF